MITPLDIENKKFSKQMVNGYNVDEVDEFLDEITADYEKLYKENMGLFLDYIQKESPNSQIILNPVRLGYKILKNDNKIEVNKNFKSNAKNTNKLLKKVDNILKKQKDVITLKIKKERILDENHEWGLGQVHYTQPYYLNILNQLKQISKNDKSLLSKIYELF